MAEIRILPESVANQIAAGEVVENPGSVVKELVENALDAGASRVRIETVGGGLELIRVVDNGCGIPADEVLTAFARHGTSKLTAAEELWSLSTLGFRGEALPSIASVAKVDLVTRRPSDLGGSAVTAEGGSLSEVLPTGAAVGTTITVRDLFFNTPARLKFLKAQSSESARIAATVTGLSLAHPAVAMSLVQEGREVLSTPGRGGLSAAAGAVLGTRVARELLEVDFVSPFAKVSGLVGPPHVARGNRSLELFFINGRVVQSRTLAAAIEKAYGSLLPLRRFPLALVSLELPADQVDVNVHPTKREVRFRHDGEVYRAAFTAVKEALGRLPMMGAFEMTRRVADSAHGWGQATLPSAVDAGPTPGLLFREEDIRPPFTPQTARPTCQGSGGLQGGADPGSADEPDARAAGAQVFEAVDTSSPGERPGSEPVGYRYLGQFAKSYLVVETDGQLALVDQHAAHERVICDGLTAKQRSGLDLVVQRFLLPESFELTLEEAQLMRRVLADLQSLGIEVEEFGHKAFIVRAVPAVLAQVRPVDLLTNALNEVAATGSGGGVYESLWDRVLATIACKAAIKAGQALSADEAQALLDSWAVTQHPWTCPHGRPVALTFGLTEISRRFLRGSTP